jgi:uncharacterized protein (DUF433 family)
VPLMSVTIEPEAPLLRIDETGAIRVGDSRIVLELVVVAYFDGASPETIVEMYPPLRADEVYGAIGYYLRHRAKLDEYFAKRAAQADNARQRIEANQPRVEVIRARLRNRRANVLQ